MKIILCCTLLVGNIFLASLGWSAEKSICNPQPTEGDLVLPGPEGLCFTFRPIEVRGETPFSGVKFVMGDPEEDSFRMPSTEVVVSGSFYKESEEPLWVYYLSKYEITRGQYRAVMGALPEALSDKEASAEKDSLPVTNLSYFEAIQFIDKLNRWLYAHALDAMPKSGAYPGFLRLPSEAEWEFAARGGIIAEKTLFESPTPYGDALAAHEWFNGPKSSHGKMKAVGLLKPNLLGLHDMLGNVQEMVTNQYQFEYYQGRSGGFTSRGSSFITAEDKLNSAQRQEEPYYLARKGTLNPNTKITLGLRLLMSAPLFTDKATIEEFEDTWDAYRTGGRTQTPAGLAMAPLGDQASASFKDAFERIQALKNLPAEQYAQVPWKQELSFAVNGMLKGKKAQDEAHIKTANSLVGHTHTLAQELTQHLRHYESLSARLKTKEGQDDYNTWKKRVDILEFSITGKLEQYGENFLIIDTIPAKFTQEAFIARVKETKEKIDKGMTQEEINVALQILQKVQNHFNDFTKNKRTNIPKWRKDYENSLKK